MRESIGGEPGCVSRALRLHVYMVSFYVSFKYLIPMRYIILIANNAMRYARERYDASRYLSSAC